jgi:biotin synthase
VLLTTKNPQRDRDTNLLDRLGVKSRLNEVKSAHAQHAHD